METLERFVHPAQEKQKELTDDPSSDAPVTVRAATLAPGALKPRDLRNWM